MRITRLRLQNVKRHADLTLELAPGLNVIRGPNEAGKSTVQKAIEMGLFRRPTSSSDELDGVRRWGAPGSPPTITVGFEDEGVTGELVKVFAGQKGTVELRTKSEVQTDPAAVDQRISTLTGLPTEKFFRATASIHHQELTGLKQDEGTLRDRLQQSMSGADRGTFVAKRKLDEAIRRYRSEGAKNPGFLKLANAQVARLEAEVSRGEAGLRQLELDRQAAAQARDGRRAIDTELARFRSGLEASERATALLQRQADAERRYALYKRAAELRSDIGRLEASHPAAVGLTNLKAAVERLRTFEYRLSEMRAELASEPDFAAFELSVPSANPRPWRLMAVVLAVAAVALAAVGFVAGQLVVGLILAALLGVAAAVAALAGSRARRQISQRAVANQLRDSEIARRRQGRSERADELRAAERERDETLASVGVADLAAAETLLNAEMEHVGRIDGAKAEYRGLFGDNQPKDDVSVLRDAAAAEAEECRHALAGMAEIGADPAKALASYRAQVERVNAEREKAVQVEAQADARLDANAVDAEQVAADSEALDDAIEQVHLAERRLRIYDETLAALNEAEKATMKKAARYLEQGMSKDVARITGGRYRRLRVDEVNLAFSVFSPELGDWIDVRSLSQGTLDQLYLCARLGIVRQVTQPASPPLVFDDPFVTFDDARARRAFELLKDIARENQVIYLTTSDRYDDLADRVVTLPAPEALDAPPKPAQPVATELTQLELLPPPGNGAARTARETAAS
jgi:DNA repair exonuclease SbcCD ATPase subunit